MIHYAHEHGTWTERSRKIGSLFSCKFGSGNGIGTCGANGASGVFSVRSVVGAWGGFGGNLQEVIQYIKLSGASEQSEREENSYVFNHCGLVAILDYGIWFDPPPHFVPF